MREIYSRRHSGVIVSFVSLLCSCVKEKGNLEISGRSESLSWPFEEYASAKLAKETNETIDQLPISWARGIFPLDFIGYGQRDVAEAGRCVRQIRIVRLTETTFSTPKISTQEIPTGF